MTRIELGMGNDGPPSRIVTATRCSIDPRVAVGELRAENPQGMYTRSVVDAKGISSAMRIWGLCGNWSER